MSNGTTELYDLEASKMQKSMPVNGECSVVYELIGSYVTEETSKYTGKTTETTNAYYYAIPMLGDEDYCMLLKTSANSAMTAYADKAVEVYWDDDATWDDVFAHSFKVDGILTTNDPEIAGFYNEWVDSWAESEEDREGFTLAPYTLDCTRTVSARLKAFWAGIVLLVAFIGAAVFAIFTYVSKRRQRLSMPAYDSVPTTTTYGNNYSNLSGQSSNMYDPTTTFSSGSSERTSNNFQTQGSTVTTNSAQGAGSDFYGQQNGFIPQSGQSSNGYNSYTPYQQGGYNNQNGFQTQGGQSSNSYDSYPSQNNSDYGNDNSYNRF